jgi:hypothetical protein
MGRGPGQRGRIRGRVRMLAVTHCAGWECEGAEGRLVETGAMCSILCPPPNPHTTICQLERVAAAGRRLG